MGRAFLLSLVVLAALAAGPSAAYASDEARATAELQQPSRDIDVDIDVSRGGDAWYTSPVWIAIGVLGLILIVLLIAIAVRGGGGTTIVRG
jgi:hypothetical protein